MSLIDFLMSKSKTSRKRNADKMHLCLTLATTLNYSCICSDTNAFCYTLTPQDVGLAGINFIEYGYLLERYSMYAVERLFDVDNKRLLELNGLFVYM